MPLSKLLKPHWLFVGLACRDKLSRVPIPDKHSTVAWENMVGYRSLMLIKALISDG